MREEGREGVGNCGRCLSSTNNIQQMLISAIGYTPTACSQEPCNWEGKPLQSHLTNFISAMKISDG